MLQRIQIFGGCKKQKRKEKKWYGRHEGDIKWKLLLLVTIESASVAYCQSVVMRLLLLLLLLLPLLVVIRHELCVHKNVHIPISKLLCHTHTKNQQTTTKPETDRCTLHNRFQRGDEKSIPMMNCVFFVRHVEDFYITSVRSGIVWERQRAQHRLSWVSIWKSGQMLGIAVFFLKQVSFLGASLSRAVCMRCIGFETVAAAVVVGVGVAAPLQLPLLYATVARASSSHRHQHHFFKCAIHKFHTELAAKSFTLFKTDRLTKNKYSFGHAAKCKTRSCLLLPLPLFGLWVRSVDALSPVDLSIGWAKDH